MGQHFYIVNLDRREYLDPLNLGGGMKLWEIAANPCLNVLAFLLRQSSGGGGGDTQKPYVHAGRWAGDRIAIVGDYDESEIFQQCGHDEIESALMTADLLNALPGPMDPKASRDGCAPR